MDWTEHKAVSLSVRILRWVLAILIAYLGAKLTWLIVDQPVLVLPEARQSESGSPKRIQQQFNIASWNLFGEANLVPVKLDIEPEAKKTTLRLHLLGVFTSPDKTQGSAIIAEQGREGEFFKVGDRVQGRATLAQVFDDKVILDNNGKIESLPFDDADKNVTGITRQAAPARPTKKREKRGSFNERIQGIRTPEDFVGFAKDELANNPEEAMRNVGLKQADVGYEVTSSASMLMSLGMKPGDKIISINGQSLGDPAQDKELIDEVYAQGSARIEVERGSRRFVINHQFK